MVIKKQKENKTDLIRMCLKKELPDKGSPED
jgi:hypothetical protein